MLYKVSTYYAVEKNGVHYDGNLETDVFAHNEEEAVRWHETYVAGQLYTAFGTNCTIIMPLSYAVVTRKASRRSFVPAW